MNAIQRLRVRRAMVRFCLRGIANEGAIHYRAFRPIDYLPCDGPGASWTGDCSAFAISGAKCSGAPDPSGFGFNRAGNSTSIARGRRRIHDIRDVHRGDYVVFGYFHADGTIIKTTHVAEVLSHPRRRWKRNLRNTLVCSHGAERGPFATLLERELMDPSHAGETVQYYSLIHAA